MGRPGRHPAVPRRPVDDQPDHRGAHLSRFGLLVRFTARPGEGDTVAAALVEADRLLDGADGVEVHVVHRPVDDPDVVWVSEVFRDRDAHRAAMADPGIQAAAGRIAPLLAGPPERIETLPLT